MVWFEVSVLKIILLILISIKLVFAFDATAVKAEILSKIAYEFVKKDVANIYTDDAELLKIKGLSLSLNHSSLEDADIVFVTQNSENVSIDSEKYIFTTCYNTFKKYPHIVGVFFWQKGRPNIIIREEIVKKQNITLSEPFQRFLE